MFHNKTLGAAIAMALSLGVNSTEAATFQVCVRNAQLPSYSPTAFDATKHCINPSSPLTYAYEQFSTTQATLDYPFRARYTVSSTIGTNYDFYITFSLSNQATWATALTSANLTFNDTAGNTLSTSVAPKISIVNHGGTADSDVSYLINSQAKSGVSTAQVLNFEFTVSNAQYALKSPGGQITLTADLRAAQSAVPTTGTVADTSLTTTLATSTEGADVQIAAPTSTNPVYISVLQDGKQFEGSGKKSNTQVDYGYISIKAKSTPPLNKTATLAPTPILNGASLTTGTATPWSPDVSFSKGKLTIDNGNFNASGAASAGMVYIDKSDFVTSLVNATSFSSDMTTATWEFATNAPLSSIFGDSSRNIVLNVDGKTSIIENRKSPPKATLYVEYNGGAGVTRTAVLRHLKKNGSVCTLYNIPAPTEGLDTLNIRVTNDSATVTGFVKGTLRDMTGKEIYKGKFLVDQGKLAPHQTVRITMADLTAGGQTWTGRAVLTVESNIPDGSMQVFGLLRNTGSKQGFPESPLMNMSTGATGNGCD